MASSQQIELPRPPDREGDDLSLPRPHLLLRCPSFLDDGLLPGDPLQPPYSHGDVSARETTPPSQADRQAGDTHSVRVVLSKSASDLNLAGGVSRGNDLEAASWEVGQARHALEVARLHDTHAVSKELSRDLHHVAKCPLNLLHLRPKHGYQPLPLKPSTSDTILQDLDAYEKRLYDTSVNRSYFPCALYVPPSAEEKEDINLLPRAKGFETTYGYEDDTLSCTECSRHVKQNCCSGNFGAVRCTVL